MGCLPLLVVVFLSAASFPMTEGRMISCACTTKHCRQEGTRTCNTTSMCFSQFLDRKDGSDPVIRGCVASRTPLLCENRRPAVGLHREWPVLMCCDKHMCNAKAYPTMPTSSTPYPLLVTSTESSLPEHPPSTESKASSSNVWYLTMLVVSILLFSLLVAAGVFFTTRQSTFCDPEFGVVGSNGYVKGCSDKHPTPSRGLENKLVLDT